MNLQSNSGTTFVFNVVVQANTTSSQRVGAIIFGQPSSTSTASGKITQAVGTVSIPMSFSANDGQTAGGEVRLSTGNFNLPMSKTINVLWPNSSFEMDVSCSVTGTGYIFYISMSGVSIGSFTPLTKSDVLRIEHRRLDIQFELMMKEMEMGFIIFV